jgi:hypothetical protein
MGQAKANSFFLLLTINARTGPGDKFAEASCTFYLIITIVCKSIDHGNSDL